MAEEHWNDGSSQEENPVHEEAPTVGNNESKSAQDMSARQSSERAEEVLDKFSRRASGWRLWLTVQAMVLYSRAREELEDIVAEAQQIRHRRNTTDIPTNSTDDLTSLPDIPTGSADAQPVGTVPGIGSTFSSRLVDGGIRTVEDLASAQPEDVARLLGTGEERAIGFIDEARRLRVQ
ncbi:MAG TPA: helix-hairpin-helix domain-containing protein [Dehalococcoidia bacterium]|nr:helix-hairpin-helix domain-containing protein [Dehalococcoidia bacterium]